MNKKMVVGIISILFVLTTFTTSIKSDENISTILLNDGNLSGYVNDTLMNPIPGAGVRVYFHGTYEEDYTDSSGYYHVTNIPICYCLKNATASKEGYETEWILLSITENTTHDFVLTPLDPIPDLDCDGSLGWYDVELGSTIYNSFKVKNVGDTGSELDWEIESHPDWGTWMFTPLSGTGLKPDDDPVTINVTLVVPDEQIEFTGIVRVVNKENPSDYCELQIFLTSPPFASLIKPERAIYINNERIMWFFVPLIIGSGGLDIEVTTSDMIDWIEFYIDGELQHIDSTRPFSWTWDEPKPLRHEIRVKAHDPTKKYTTCTINVWRFF